MDVPQVLKIKLPYDPALPLPYISEENKVTILKRSTLMFTAALFTIKKKKKQPGNNLSVHHWTNGKRKGGIYIQWNIIQP